MGIPTWLSVLVLLAVVVLIVAGLLFAARALRGIRAGSRPPERDRVDTALEGWEALGERAQSIGQGDLADEAKRNRQVLLEYLTYPERWWATRQRDINLALDSNLTVAEKRVHRAELKA